MEQLRAISFCSRPRSYRKRNTSLILRMDYVPGNIIHVMCPPALCSRATQFPEIVAKSTGISKFEQLDRAHNESVSVRSSPEPTPWKGDFRAQPIFHSSNYRRSNPRILDRRADRALRRVALRAKVCRAK